MTSAGKLWGTRRMADEKGLFKMTAVDQRPPIKNPIREKRGTEEAPWEDVAGFKTMLIEELQQESSAMLIDPHYAYPRGISAYSPAKGLILTLEDSVFEETPDGRLSNEIDHWSVEKIKRRRRRRRQGARLVSSGCAGWDLRQAKRLRCAHWRGLREIRHSLCL